MFWIKALGEWQIAHPVITAWLDYVMWIPLAGWFVWVTIVCHKKSR